MLKVALDFKDSTMPRTVFYNHFLRALEMSPAFVVEPAAANLLFPHEDTALERNWPRYGQLNTAFVRGEHNPSAYQAYLKNIFQVRRPLCLVNMHPFIRLPVILQNNPFITIADINLRTFERSLNARTISMPALPILTATNHGPKRSILASFRGVASHPVRHALAKISDGQKIVTELIDNSYHCGKIDALNQENGTTDKTYLALLETSVFAFVPRGDAEFSYRLLEVMSAGCIPVILSDGLVLPFDRTINWSAFSLHVPEKYALNLPTILAGFPAKRIATMQKGVKHIYDNHFSCMKTIVASLLREAELTIGRI